MTYLFEIKISKKTLFIDIERFLNYAENSDITKNELIQLVKLIEKIQDTINTVCTLEFESPMYGGIATKEEKRFFREMCKKEDELIKEFKDKFSVIYRRNKIKKIFFNEDFILFDKKAKK